MNSPEFEFASEFATANLHCIAHRSPLLPISPLPSSSSFWCCSCCCMSANMMPADLSTTAAVGGIVSVLKWRRVCLTLSSYLWYPVILPVYLGCSHWPALSASVQMPTRSRKSLRLRTKNWKSWTRLSKCWCTPTQVRLPHLCVLFFFSARATASLLAVVMAQSAAHTPNRYGPPLPMQTSFSRHRRPRHHERHSLRLFS